MKAVVVVGIACLGIGYCAGVAVTRGRDAWILDHARESQRMALDAAVASTLAIEPTPHECAEAARADMDRAGFRAVRLEGW